MASGGIAALLRIAGLGAILAAVSELWFYPVALNSHVFWLCVFYGPIAYTAWLAMARTRVRTWAGAFWGACLFGFLVEGIPVPVLYQAIPFTILWTSIAWHALISAALGIWGFRYLCARKSLPTQIIACALAGLYVGAWSVELWSLRGESTTWHWTPSNEAATQFAVGWFVFVAGHIALDLTAERSVIPMRFELPIFAGLLAFVFCIGMGLAFFPLSLLLPILVLISVAVMRADGAKHAGPAPFLVRLTAMRIPLSGYAASALIPIIAALTYAALREGDIQLESSAFHILWAGPVSIILLVWSGLHIWRHRAQD